MRIHGHATGSILLLAERLTDRNDIAVRWGGPQVAGAINGECHLMDGLEQLQTLKEKGIVVPEFIVQTDYIQNVDITGWLARRRNHTQGRDIIPVGQHVHGRRRWQNSDYFVKYQPARAEWRFHILEGVSIARGLKYYTGVRSTLVPEPINTPIIRSRRLLWHLRHDISPPAVIREAAKAATAAVGYDLGAVDVLELEDGSPCVLEVNSRPAILDEYTLNAYSKALRNL